MRTREGGGEASCSVKLRTCMPQPSPVLEPRPRCSARPAWATPAWSKLLSDALTAHRGWAEGGSGGCGGAPGGSAPPGTARVAPSPPPRSRRASPGDGSAPEGPAAPSPCHASGPRLSLRPQGLPREAPDADGASQASSSPSRALPGSGGVGPGDAPGSKAGLRGQGAKRYAGAAGWAARRGRLMYRARHHSDSKLLCLSVARPDLSKPKLTMANSDARSRSGGWSRGSSLQRARSCSYICFHIAASCIAGAAHSSSRPAPTPRPCSSPLQRNAVASRLTRSRFGLLQPLEGLQDFRYALLHPV